MKSILCLALLTAALYTAPARAQGQDEEKRDTSPYTLPRFDVVDTTQVDARHMTLAEIIQRCTEGERTKLSGHENMTYSGRVRTIVEWKEKKREVEEEIWILYEDSSGYARGVLLNRRTQEFKYRDGKWKPSEADEIHTVEVELSDGESTFTEIPFYLESVKDFHFELINTTLLEDRVIYEIKFTPKSDFKPLPSGTVFVDTKNFRIVHEVFTFDEGHNPFPMMISDIRRISRHWKLLPTGEWVTDRLAMDIGLKRWFGLIPDAVVVGIELDDYKFDQEYDERKFGPR